MLRHKVARARAARASSSSSPPEGTLARGRGGRGGARRSTGVARVRDLPPARATRSGRSGAAPTARAPCSPSATTATRRSRALAVRPTQYASSSMQRRCVRRQLGFQPPAIGEEEIAAVAETLRSGWLTTGPRAAELEERMAEYLEAKHVLAVASGHGGAAPRARRARHRPGRRGDHDADHLAGDRERDRPHRRDAGLRRRARGRPEHRPGARRRAVTERTKAILPVHLAGQPCDLDPIWALGLPVIEDAAHAAESAYRGRKLGGLSEATCFSLYATKNIAAGEGGLVATNSDEVADGDPRPAADAARRRLALRHHRARLQGEPLRRARRDRARPARQARASTRARRQRQFELYDEARRRARRDRAARARPARHARAPPLRRPGRRRALRR